MKLPFGSSQKAEDGPRRRTSQSKSRTFKFQERTSEIIKPRLSHATETFHLGFVKIKGNTTFQANAFAFVAFFVCGVIPIALYFRFCYDPWNPRNQRCEAGTRASGVSGVEGMFTIDRAFGRMSFSLAKFVDSVWDLVVARGAQTVLWFISYMVFASALLRVIEMTPTPYRSFMSVSIEGATLTTAWLVFADLMRHRKKRSAVLFFFIGFSTIYILFLPTLLSTMTGYVPAPKLFIRLPSTGLLVDFATVKEGMVFYDGERLGLKNGTCIPQDGIQGILEMPTKQIQFLNCPCRLPNDTIVDPPPKYLGTTNFTDYGMQCTFNVSNGVTVNNPSDRFTCGQDFTVTLEGRIVNLGTSPLNHTRSYCHNGEGLGLNSIFNQTVCMNNVDADEYQWGFSAVLASIVVILHVSWSVGMYVIWLDAQLHSKLVRAGYVLSPLRGAFAIVATAQKRLGMGPEELVNAPLKQVEPELYGKSSAVDFSVFSEYLAASRAKELEERQEGVPDA